MRLICVCTAPDFFYGEIVRREQLNLTKGDSVMLHWDDCIAHARRHELLDEAREERKALEAYEKERRKLSRRILKSIRNLASMLGIL